MVTETYLDVVKRSKEYFAKYCDSPNNSNTYDSRSFIKSLISYNDNIIPYEGLHDNDKLGPEDTIFYGIRDKYVFISCSFPSESHQIAHMVEIPEHRLMLDNWGMTLSNKPETFSDKGLGAATSRECRVRAIESVIIGETYRYNGSVVWNECVEADLFARLPFLKFKSKQDLRNWYQHLFKTTQAKWDRDRIEHEWKRRIDLIQEKIHINPIN